MASVGNRIFRKFQKEGSVGNFSEQRRAAGIQSTIYKNAPLGFLLSRRSRVSGQTRKGDELGRVCAAVSVSRGT